MVPAAELVRFSNSGTEAVMAALRLARAYTGKDDYVILEGSYHGLFDAAMWYTPMDKWTQVGDPVVYPYSEGIPLSTRSFAHFVQANDANQLEDVLKRHAGPIACLLIEPIMGNCLGIAADPAYIRAARELCDRYGVVLIIDEVKTRLPRRARRRAGAVRRQGRSVHLRQGDGATAIRSRCSPGARRSCARSARGVAHGGTYTAHSVSLAAAEKTLQILDETDALERIARIRHGACAQGMSAILKARGIAHSFVGHPSMSGLYFAHEPPRNYRDWKGSDYTFYDAAAKVLHDERVLCEPDSREPWFISAAHDDACLKRDARGLRGGDRHDSRRARQVGAGCRPEQARARIFATRARAAGHGQRPAAGAMMRSWSAPATTAWSPPATWRAPGLKVLVLERNPYIGGAAVSRRLYDGFTYSNCSYVCSLLRPEIIRALDLPGHGLQIIPYEGGCTLMRNGGHLALYDNHDALRREIARHSQARCREPTTATRRDMLRQCRFIKPLLLREPPDPTSFKPRDLMRAAVSRQALPQARRGSACTTRCASGP